MKKRGEHGMGRVTVVFNVSNNIDVVRAQSGDIPANQVRSVEIEGTVDTAANYLVLPSHVVEQLGLPITGKMGVRYADRAAPVANWPIRPRLNSLAARPPFKPSSSPIEASP